MLHERILVQLTLVERNGWLLRVVLSLLKNRSTFVKMELTNKAMLHWQNIELLERKRRPLLADWIEMKQKF